jgi:succinoglycan biosynthesis transport protein ExoP
MWMLRWIPGKECPRWVPDRFPREDTITLTHYLAVLKRRGRIIAVAIGAALAVAIVGVVLAEKSYDATTTVRVATGLGLGADSVRLDSVEYTDRLMNTYRELVLKKPLLDKVARRSGASERPEVDVGIPSNTELLEITVRADDPRLAQRQADLVAAAMVAQARELARRAATATEQAFEPRLQALQREFEAASQGLAEATAAGASESDLAVLREQVRIKEQAYTALLEQSTAAQSAATSRASSVSIETRASRPTSPSRPRVGLTLALALMLGLVCGIGLAFLQESLDRRVYNREHIVDATGLPILASIPRGPPRTGLIYSFQGQEAFSRLRTNLVALDGDRRLSRILITSAEPGAGKSTVTANLAISLARDGRRVLAVDGDLRIPSLHEIFELPNETGLSTLLVNRILTEELEVDEVVQPTQVTNLSVLTSGAAILDPSERLGSRDMAALVGTLSNRYDVVLVDTPALLSVSDAAELVSVVEAVLLVVREGHTTRQGAHDAREQLDTVKAPRIGVVVNSSSETVPSYYLQSQRPVSV